MRRLKEREVMILLFLLAVVATVGLYHKSRRSSPKHELLKIARETAAMWQHELELTATQHRQVGTVITTYSGKKNQILTSNLNQETLARTLKALQLQEQSKMADILTKEQYKKYLHLTRMRIFGQQTDLVS